MMELSADDLASQAGRIMEAELCTGKGLRKYYVAADVRNLCWLSATYPSLLPEAQALLERLLERSDESLSTLELRTADALERVGRAPPQDAMRSE